MESVSKAVPYRTDDEINVCFVNINQGLKKFNKPIHFSSIHPFFFVGHRQEIGKGLAE